MILEKTKAWLSCRGFLTKISPASSRILSPQKKEPKLLSFVRDLLFPFLE
jgi:hypothetical protein